MILSNFTPNYPKGKLLKISEYCRDEINFDFKYLLILNIYAFLPF